MLNIIYDVLRNLNLDQIIIHKTETQIGKILASYQMFLMYVNHLEVSRFEAQGQMINVYEFVFA